MPHKNKPMGQDNFESGIEFYEEHIDKILPKCPWCGKKDSCRYTRNPNGMEGDIMKLSCKSCHKDSSCRIGWG